MSHTLYSKRAIRGSLDSLFLPKKKRTITTGRGSSPLVPIAWQRAIGNRGVRRLIQTKLRIGKPGDRYEREADRIADLVTRMPEPGINRQPT